MPKARTTLSLAERAYLRKIKTLLTQSASFYELLLSLRQERNTYLAQKSRLEAKSIDPSFIDELEKGFDAIDAIIKNPRTFIKEDDVLVEAGRAKRISPRSISHLASHTQYVHNVDEDGNVTPEKLMVPESDIDYWIYENRFIMTLIKKCSVFIQKRLLFIKDHGETRDSEVLLLHTDHNVGEVKYEVDTRIKLSCASTDSGKAKANEDLLIRLAKLRERVAYFASSPFMSAMKGAKEVANPIHPTNLLVKNPEYKKALALWKFIDSYKELGIEVSVKEDSKKFKDDYVETLCSLLAASIVTLEGNLVKDDVVKAKSVKKKIIPKVLFSLEDETFYDGRFLYDQFPLRERKKISPLYPTVEESKAYREELERKRAEDKAKKAIVEAEIERAKEREIELQARANRKMLEEQRKQDERELIRAAIEAEKAKLSEQLEAKRKADRAAEEELRKLRKARIMIVEAGKKDRAGEKPAPKSSDGFPDETPIVVEQTPIIASTPEEQGIKTTVGKPKRVRRVAKKAAKKAKPAKRIEEEKPLEAEAVSESPVAEEPIKEEAPKQEDVAAILSSAPEEELAKGQSAPAVEESTPIAEEAPKEEAKPAEETEQKEEAKEEETPQKEAEEPSTEPEKPADSNDSEQEKPVDSASENKPEDKRKKKGKAARKAKKEEKKAEEASKPSKPTYTTLKTRSKRGGRSFVVDYARKGKRR